MIVQYNVHTLGRQTIQACIKFVSLHLSCYLSCYSMMYAKLEYVTTIMQRSYKGARCSCSDLTQIQDPLLVSRYMHLLD